MSLSEQELHPAGLAGNSVIAPRGVIRPTFGSVPKGELPSTNQRLPSAPLVMDPGWLLAVGTRVSFSAPIGDAASAVGTSSMDSPAVSRTRRNTLIRLPPETQV